MSYHIGRRLSVGFSKETTRAQVALPVTFWLPKIALTIDDKINTVVDDSSVAVIEDAENQEIANTYSDGTIEGRANDTSLGLWILATLGTETSQSAHSGESAVYDHIFNVNESAPHTSLSLFAVGPNEGTTGVIYSLAMVDSLELDLEIGKYVMYKVGFRANKSQTKGTLAASFSSTENAFRPQDGVVKFATNQAGLAAASAITLRKAIVTIKKNIEEDWTIGATAAADRVNKQFVIEGSVELVYADRSYVDTIMLGDLVKAMRISAVNTSVTLGNATNPTVQIDLFKVKLQEVARKIDNNNLVLQTLKFKAYYSLSDSKMVTITLTNTQSTAY